MLNKTSFFHVLIMFYSTASQQQKTNSIIKGNIQASLINRQVSMQQDNL